MTSTGTENELQSRLELLAGKAIGDLTHEEHVLVDELLGEQRWQTELWQLEVAAAAIAIRYGPSNLPAKPLDQLPKNLQKIIENDARTFFESQPDLADPTARNSVVSTLSAPLDSKKRSNVPIREWLAWIACAASLLLAMAMWNQRSESVTLSVAKQRELLLESADDLIRTKWIAGKTPFPTTVTGDVVWSPKGQSGFMRFDGMPINDPSVEQYQLWIIDPSRDKNPIDGGVFDVKDSGEVVIPINAKLAVAKPAAFAITIEQPGGVVVSDQSRLPLLAAVP